MANYTKEEQLKLIKEYIRNLKEIDKEIELDDKKPEKLNEE